MRARVIFVVFFLMCLVDNLHARGRLLIGVHPGDTTSTRFSGVASFYDTGSRKYTAAHRTLPKGTRLRVTNRLNKKSVEVVINDRGPFIRGRVIDLSESAARYLDMITVGLVIVDVQAAEEAVRKFLGRLAMPGKWTAGRPAAGPYVLLPPFPNY
jgi:rare lipoprotein A (peptidoglycan hydrolase)